MENPIIDLKNLSKPLTRLVDVVAAGIGTVYAPFGTVREAKANARAKIINAQADIEVVNLYARAGSRLIHREEMRQENIEAIAKRAATEIPESVSDEPVDRDWITQFFDHSQDTSESDMQILWACILTGEVARPGAYAKRTLQLLKTLEKWEAVKFSELCSLTIRDANGWPLLFDGSIKKHLKNSVIVAWCSTS